MSSHGNGVASVYHPGETSTTTLHAVLVSPAKMTLKNRRKYGIEPKKWFKTWKKGLSEKMKELDLISLFKKQQP